jgi:hypothetical protein
MRPMTAEHESWDEFTERLAGPEGCNFRWDENGEMRWQCAGGNDKSLAIGILQRMGEDIDIPASLAYFEEHGGFCDCEIVFNVAREFLDRGEKQRKGEPDRSR